MSFNRAAALAASLLVAACQPTNGAGRGTVMGGAADVRVRDIDGKLLRLSDYRDDVVLIVFWSSWCRPCFGKLRYIDTLYRELKGDGLVVIAPSMDLPQTRTRVKPAVRRYKLSFRVFIDKQDQLVNRFNPRRTQALTLLLYHGRVVRRWGPLNTADLPELRQRIERQLAKHNHRPVHTPTSAPSRAAPKHHV